MNIEDLLPTYQRDLVYVDYRDELSPGQVEEIIHEGWSESVDEWISEAQWESAWKMAGDLLERNPGLLIERHELADEVRELDTSDPYRDLLRNTGSMQFRYSPPEDDMVWLGDITDTAEKLHAELGLPDEFLPVLRDSIWAEIEGYTISGGGFGATFVFSCNPSDLLGKERIVVHEPFLWLCNPWAGNGWGEVAEGCTVTLDMEDVHVDKFAWGYGADDVFGGLILPDSAIEAAVKEEA